MVKEIEVLLASYNGEQYVAEQIHSIYQQTYPHLRVIVRDDCSSDKTVQVVKELQALYPTVTLLRNHQNEGLIQNFSSLMIHSQADYVMLSDQDDIWLKDKVSKSLAKMKELEKIHGHDTPLLVHSDLAVVGKDLKPISPSFWKYSRLNPVRGTALNRMVAQNTLTGCTLLLNRPLVNIALPIPKETVMHDWWLGLVCAAFGQIGIVNEPTILYRQHGLNDTGAKEYGIISALQRMMHSNHRDKIRKNHFRRFEQAQVFLERYQSSLSRKQNEMIKSFITFPKKSFLSKAYLMASHGLWKQGVMRNLYEVFLA